MSEKVRNANVPEPQPSSIASLRPPSQAVTERFGRALLPTRAEPNEDAIDSNASLRSERDDGLESREGTDAHRSFAAMDERLRRAHILGERLSVTSAAGWPAARIDAADLAPTARAESKAELSGLIERMCSAMYVGDKSVISQRIVLGLDHVLPGVLAEIVREGAQLTVRLNARSEYAHRLMSSQREELQRALAGDDGSLRVEVLVQTIDGAMEEDRG